jgi:hypothetical protein
MKHFKSYFNQLSYSKSITITKKYCERYCCYKQASSGGSFVVDFTITIQQNEVDYSNLYFVENENTTIAIESISLGIERYIDFLNKQEVAIIGIDFIVDNVIVHPVDFKPIRYDIETSMLLRRIFFTHGKHLLTCKFDSNTKSIDFPNKSVVTLFEELQIRKAFPLPNTLQKVLKLPERTYLQTEFAYNDFKESIQIELATDFYTERHMNGIHLYSDSTMESIQLFLIAEEVIQKLIKDVYDNDFNLMSFHIGIREIKMESTYFLNYGTFQDEFYWHLKNFILTYNNISQL